MKSEDNNKYELAATQKNKEPLLYQVVVHNDDFTPMEFVISILERFFYMSRRSAMDTMLDAHFNGKAICGVYTRDIAESKISEVVSYSTTHEYPLICSMDAVY